MTTELLRMLAIISLAVVSHAVWFVYFKLSRRMDAIQCINRDMSRQLIVRIEKLENPSKLGEPTPTPGYDKFVENLPESPFKASLFKTNGET